MAAETLNFGPEWLRALSSGGSVASPPPSPAMPKYKLADYRYGREEMLALYVKENKVPDELQDKEFAAVLQEEPLQPLALEPLTEEEQRNFSLSVNSVAVLRLMGKGAGPPLGGASRGRGSTRSRGRGRGDSCFYQRSIEEGEGAFGRNPREIQRSQSWDDRGERRFEKSARRDGARSGFEEGGAGPRKEHARSDSENWRSLREEQEEEEEGSWRLGAGPRRDGDRWRSASPGPFTTQEMAEWFQAGYFSMALLVKRGCDEGFQPLGEVIKMWGRVPFAPGPSPPPLLGNMDQERLKKQQELAAAALYQQLQHQQFLQLVGSRQLPQCALREKAALGDLTPPQQQLTAFLQQLQALKPPRGGDQNLLPTMNRSLSVPDSGPLWDIHTSASSQSGGEASLWDIPINSSTQGPILEQLQLQHKFQERREVELRAKREEEERKRREEKRRQQQQQEEQKRRQEEEELFRRKQVRQQELLLKLLQQQQAAAAVPASPAPSSPPPLWAGLAKQGLSMKTLLELQLEGERQLHKQPPPREPSRAQAPNHRVQLGGLGAAPLNQWVSEAGPLWGGPDKSGGSSGGLGLWEDTLKSSGSLARSLGLKNSRSSPSLSDSYSHLSGRPVRKKTEEEEKLLKLLQGIPRPQDGFTQWCEQMLHTLSTTGSLDVPMAVAILKEVESPYDVHDYIRSCLGDTLEAKEFAKQFLERRAKQKASQQRQQEAWLSGGSLQTAFQTNHSTKLGPGEGSKAKRRALMLHSDPSILGYSLHGPSGEIESVDDY
ncbi:GRB10-interacting GYF protein 1 [Puma concolor]|uniref:GRB10-interacting GYF protein 1 n=1 Tax=Puma concolor TaxID=9696 RepID=A0A6P6HT10_PUMCO|nr:GRB10-interacting GYF protein 1 [Puma concolor]